MKVLRRLYSNIKEYNYEEEWGIMVRTVEHEAAAQQEAPVSYREIFRGANLVSRGAVAESVHSFLTNSVEPWLFVASSWPLNGTARL